MNINPKYSFNLRYSEDDEGYIAVSPEFPGLSAFGETPEEAIAEAKVALVLFIETYQEENKPLPEPNVAKEYSGQIRIRLPKSLHQRLSMQAEEEGTSINTLMIQYISEGLSFTKKKHSGKDRIIDLLKSYLKHEWELSEDYTKQILIYSSLKYPELSSVAEKDLWKLVAQNFELMSDVIKADTEEKIETL